MQLKSILFVFGLLLSLNILHAQNIETLRTKAKAGETEAMLELAEAFRFGFAITENADSADHWTHKAAEGNNPEAQYLVGVGLLKNIFKQSGYDKGIVWLKKSAESGYADANLKLREVYLDRGTDVNGRTSSAKYYSSKSAFAYGLAAAEARSSKGAMFTGEALILGKGTEKNIEEGQKWLEKSAGIQKNTYAQLKYAKLFLEGNITGKPAVHKAREWYFAAYTNPKSGLDERIKADIGLSEVDKYFRNTHNLMMQANPFLPAGAYFYPIR